MKPTSQGLARPEVLSGPSHIWTVVEAADYLRVPVSYVRLLIARGDFQYQRLGKRHFVKAADVRAYLERNWRREGR